MGKVIGGIVLVLAVLRVVGMTTSGRGADRRATARGRIVGSPPRHRAITVGAVAWAQAVVRGIRRRRR